jgi:hypothetical protein
MLKGDAEMSAIHQKKTSTKIATKQFNSTKPFLFLDHGILIPN